MPLYYMVKYSLSTIKFQCKQCTEKLVEPHWTDTAYLFRDPSREATIVKTDEPRTEERRTNSTAKKNQHTLRFLQKSHVDTASQVKNVNSCMEPHAENKCKTQKNLKSTRQRLSSRTLQIFEGHNRMLQR